MLYLIIARYRESWSHRHFRFSAPAALAAFIGALFINFWAIQQATNKASASVTDIILSNIPVFEVDGFFVYGTFAIVLISVIMLLAHPNRIPFAPHSVTLFILIRSAFTLMTHLGPPEVAFVSAFGETIPTPSFGATSSSRPTPGCHSSGHWRFGALIPGSNGFICFARSSLRPSCCWATSTTPSTYFRPSLSRTASTT